MPRKLALHISSTAEQEVRKAINCSGNMPRNMPSKEKATSKRGQDENEDISVGRKIRWISLPMPFKALGGLKRTDKTRRSTKRANDGFFRMARFASLHSSKSSLSEQGTVSISSASLKSATIPVEADPGINLPQQKVPSEVLSLGRPLAGSSTRQIPNDTHIPCNNTNECNHVIKAASFHDEAGEESTGIQWRQVKGETLMVRSTDYHKSNAKEPSAGELYECLHVDVLKSTRRLASISNRVELPDLSLDDEIDQTEVRPDSWFAPDIFVVTLSMPMESNGDTEAATCLTISAYFGMKAETKAILRRINNLDDEISSQGISESEMSRVNAVRLFNEWCRRSPTEPSFQGRFKLVPHITNLGALGVPGWIANFSGKPVLIKRSNKTGFLYSRQDESRHVMEMEVSLHPFPWLAKRALEQLRREFFHKSLLTLGFVIEAREEQELPEVLIGLTQLCYPNAESAVSSSDFFPQSERDDTSH